MHYLQSFFKLQARHIPQASYPRCGPPFMRSKTWAGFSSCLNLLRNFTPWLSPLFELTKTNKGLVHDGGHVAFQKPGGRMGKDEENVKAMRHEGTLHRAGSGHARGPCSSQVHAQEPQAICEHISTAPPPRGKESPPSVTLHLQRC